MKVLHVGTGNLWGGIEAILVALARAGSDAGVSQDFALCFEGRAKEELERTGARVHFLGGARWRYPWTIWRARRKFSQVLCDGNYDVVVYHSSWTISVFAGLQAHPMQKSIFWVHDQWKKGGWLIALARRQKPDRVICHSRYTTENLAGFFPGVERHLIPNPVAVPEVSSASRVELRTQLKVPPDSVVILMVSRMEKWKGHTVLIDALAQLSARKDWTAWVVGGAQSRAEKSYEQALKEQAARLGLAHRVHYLGQQSQVGAYYRAADIFVQPNLEPEPFGNVFVEAMHSGLPVVGMARGGVLDVVTPECGILLSKPDPLELAQVLSRLIEDPKTRTQMGQQGAARARELCDPAQVFGRFLRVAQALTDSSLGSTRVD